MKSAPKSLIFLCSFFAITSFAGKKDAAIVYKFETGGRPREERTIASVLQGIANRKGPCIYLSDKRNGYWQHGWPKADSVWIDYFTKRGFQFQEVACIHDLFNLYKQDVNGLVVYDRKNRASFFAAITLSGLENLLPVADTYLESCGFDAPVKYDLAKMLNGKSTLEVYDWALKELMPRCNKTLVASTSSAADYIVCEKGFMYDLTHDEKDSAEYAMTMRILNSLTPPAGVYGWGGPDEGRFLKAVTRSKNYVMCTGGGLSFLSRVKPQFEKLRQIQHVQRAKKKKLENKIYIVFMLPEGDTPKIVLSVFAGHWADPMRGKVPINWGINPLFAARFPPLIDYFYSTATPNDYFFAGVGGAGYIDLKDYADIPLWARHVNRNIRQADIRYVDLWYTNDTCLKQFAEYAPDVKGYTTSFFSDTTMARIRYMQGNLPVISHKIFYWEGNTPQDLAADIMQFNEDMVPPHFSFVYVSYLAGNVHSDYRNADLPRTIPTLLGKAAQLLDTTKYKVVTLDEFFGAAKELNNNREKYPLSSSLTKAPAIDDARLPDSAGRLAAYWNFDEGAGDSIHDLSGNNNTGILAGAKKWAGGIRGKGLFFSGKTDYVDCGNGSSLDFNGAMTIAVWMKIADSKEQSYARILSKKEFYSAPNGYELEYNACDNILGYLGSAVSQDGKGETTLDIDTAWHHIAAVYRAHTAQFYCDGKLVGTDEYVLKPKPSRVPLVLGAYGNKNPSAHSFHGTLDEVRIYSYALSAKEIFELFNQHQNPG